MQTVVVNTASYCGRSLQALESPSSSSSSSSRSSKVLSLSLSLSLCESISLIFIFKFFCFNFSKSEAKIYWQSCGSLFRTHVSLARGYNPVQRSSRCSVQSRSRSLGRCIFYLNWKIGQIGWFLLIVSLNFVAVCIPI